MKRTLLFLTFIFTLFFLMSCSPKNGQTDIVTTMFTHYDLAKQIAGDKLTVSMLVPLGQDIHSFEASSVDMVHIENAKLFLYTSDEIDTWITNPSEIGGDDTIVLNMSDAIEHTSDMTLSTTLDDEHHHHDDDIHYWVDPLAAIDMLDYILEHIILIDPDNQTYYENNRDIYYNEIMDAHEVVSTYFEDVNHQNQTIYFAGHNALTAFGMRYGLTIEAIFSEFKPDDDLISSEIISFTKAVKAANTHYLFIEPLESTRAADTIKGALENESYTLTLLPLYAYHNVSTEDFEASVTYVDLMYRNFNNIKTAFGESS